MSSINPDGVSNNCLSNESEASSVQNGYQDWHCRFNLGLGELLPNWSVFIPFRRRTSSHQSSGKSCLPKGSLQTEHIELVQFPNSKSTGGQGVGHDFVMCCSNNPTWCDKCGDLLWGLYQAKYVRCQYCHYTCHPQCRDLVTLDCRAVEAELLDQRNSLLGKDATGSLDSDVKLDEFAEEETSTRLKDDSQIQSPEKIGDILRQSQKELRHLIAEYTAAAPPGLGMILEENGSTFRGFIRVHLNLSRPISVVAGSRPPSIYDILKEDETLENTLTSFYLPRETVKALHITSETTTHEVVVALLKKFKVVDNPRKFALYERYYEDGDVTRVKMRRIGENEKPLTLALQWNQQIDCNKMFVLQENETEDILWEAFTLPELGNFLRILDREEEEYKKRVHQKYELIASKLQEAMDHFKSSGKANILENARYDTGIKLMDIVDQENDSGS